MRATPYARTGKDARPRDVRPALQNNLSSLTTSRTGVNGLLQKLPGHGGLPVAKSPAGRLNSGMVHAASPASEADQRDLAAAGYKQELDRTLGRFSSFAAGFSYISILTGMFQN